LGVESFRAFHEHQTAQTKSPARGRSRCCVEGDAQYAPRRLVRPRPSRPRPSSAREPTAGCSKGRDLDSERDLDSVHRFFARGKIGTAPDAALIKSGNPKNPVLVVYGFYDSDVRECQILASCMNTRNDYKCVEVPGTAPCTDPPYSCVLLNH